MLVVQGMVNMDNGCFVHEMVFWGSHLVGSVLLFNLPPQETCYHVADADWPKTVRASPERWRETV
jgi:hypothetical protein